MNMAGFYAPLEPPRKGEVWPEKVLDISPEPSIRGVLSFNSDSESYLRLTSRSRSISKQYDDEEQEAASVESLEMDLQKQMKELPGEPHTRQPVSIYRVPASFRKKKKDLYQPRMVSIGPYYHGKKELRAMEKHKLRCLRDFISRNAEVGLSVYLQELRKLESQARQCYSESFDYLGTKKFVSMLLLDGCFILEYFLKYDKGGEIDAHCDVGWGGPTIISDLLMLENQIPFFIIHKLASFIFDLTDCQNGKGGCNLVHNLSKYFPYQEMLTVPPDFSCKSIQHLLHLYYIFLIPNDCIYRLRHNLKKRSISWHWMQTSALKEKADDDREIDDHCDVSWGGPTILSAQQEADDHIDRPRDNLMKRSISWLWMRISVQKEEADDHIDHPRDNLMKRSTSWFRMRISGQKKEAKSAHQPSVIIPCAAELHDCGVKFRRNSSTILFDINFEKGILDMPLLVVDNTIRTIFTNIVAFEQTQINKFRIFTSYVVLWNMLVDTAKDVSLLEHCGILELVQHNEDQAADFFNELADCWSLDYRYHHYNDLFIKLQKHSSSTWHKSRARLMQDYFHNPWSSISVGAGVMLIMLTVIQTIYTVWPAGGQ